MTATFWTGSSLSFTNGSKTVTVNTGPSLDSVKANSSLTAGNYNEPVEVKSVSGNTITLYNNWPGSTGTTSATIKPSAAAAAAAGVAAQQLITDIQSLVSSASATATANSFVKRDSNGRIKAASPSANDDVVNKGYFQSAAGLNEAGVYHSGNSVNPLDLGFGATAPSISDLNDAPEGSARRFSAGTLNKPPQMVDGVVLTLSRNSARRQQIAIENEIMVTRSENAPNVWTDWVQYYHSGNTNFNEFGGRAGNDVIAKGVAINTTTALFYFPLNSYTTPTSVSVTGIYYIRSSYSSSDIATGVIPSFAGESSNRLGLMTVSTTGLVKGEPLEILTQTNDGKIIFNF